MTWQNRPERRVWFDDIPIHRQREWLDWHEMRQQESCPRWVLLVCAVGIILVAAWCLWWW